MKDVSVYSTDPHEVKREVFCWGTRGKDGKQPVTFIYLKDMEQIISKLYYLHNTTYLHILSRCLKKN